LVVARVVHRLEAQVALLEEQVVLLQAQVAWLEEQVVPPRARELQVAWFRAAHPRERTE
jgi:hypothetical protein